MSSAPQHDWTNPSSTPNASIASSPAKPLGTRPLHLRPAWCHQRFDQGRYVAAMATSSPLRVDPIAEAHRHWSARGWQEAADGMALVTSVVRAQQILLGRIERVLRPFDLSFARYEVLMILFFSRKGELPLGKIGARLQVQPGAVTNAVDRLERDGLVSRCPHPTDGRATLAALTAAGRRLARKATALLNANVFAETGLSAVEARQVIGLLRELRIEAGDFER